MKRRPGMRRFTRYSLFIVCLITALLTIPIAAQNGGKKPAKDGAGKGEWRYYGGDGGSTKYSPLDQINKENAGKLKVAWAWDSPDMPLQKENRMLSSFAQEATPLMIGGRLYTSTSLSQEAAIDAVTGQTVWTFDTEARKAGRPTNLGFVHRGVAYWTDGKQERIYIATADAYLWAIDAKTGKAVAEFGDGGKVNLAKAIPLAVNSRNYAVTSPPAICRDVVIVGSSIGDGPIVKEQPRGDVQSFDVRTGKPLWIFHTVPQAGEFGNETWENESWKYTGNTNVWTLMSVDEEIGYVYIPTGTPTNDWYGGHRPGDNLFAESLICLEARTGKRVWHFQTVHHGLWDYDLPAAPTLADIKVNGRTIKAVAQITKTAQVFAFDRATGEPLFPIVETPVPASTIPGEKASPTQPIPVKPKPFDLQGVSEDQLIDFTPALHAEAVEIMNRYAHGDIYTPPSAAGGPDGMLGTLYMPGWVG